MSKFKWSFNFKVEKFLTSRMMLIIIFIFIAIAVIYTAITVSDNDLEETLQKSAQLSITVALGLSALLFALNVNRNQKSIKLMEEMIVFILLSLLSYYLSFFEPGYIQRVYIVLSGLIQLAIISQVYQVVLGKTSR